MRRKSSRRSLKRTAESCRRLNRSTRSLLYAYLTPDGVVAVVYQAQSYSHNHFFTFRVA